MRSSKRDSTRKSVTRKKMRASNFAHLLFYTHFCTRIVLSRIRQTGISFVFRTGSPAESDALVYACARLIN